MISTCYDDALDSNYAIDSVSKTEAIFNNFRTNVGRPARTIASQNEPRRSVNNAFSFHEDNTTMNSGHVFYEINPNSDR